MSKSKQTLFDEIAKYEQFASNHIIDEIRGILYCIQTTWKLTNSELCELLDRNENFVDMLLHADYKAISDECLIDQDFLARIQILSLGVFEMPGYEMDDCAKKSVTECLKEYVNIMHKTEKSNSEMVDEILGFIGINSEEDIKRVYNDIVSNQSKCDNNSCKSVDKCDDDCEEKCECKKNDDKATCNAHIFDGNEDKEYSFEVDHEAVTKFIGNLLNKLLK